MDCNAKAANPLHAAQREYRAMFIGCTLRQKFDVSTSPPYLTLRRPVVCTNRLNLLLRMFGLLAQRFARGSAELEPTIPRRFRATPRIGERRDQTQPIARPQLVAADALDRH